MSDCSTLRDAKINLQVQHLRVKSFHVKFPINLTFGGFIDDFLPESTISLGVAKL